MTGTKTALVSIVIPVFNEADGLAELVGRLLPSLDKLDSDWELVFIDDGSTDGTLAELRRLNTADPRFRAVVLSRNFGKEIAIAAGLRYARGDAAILMDADLQHPPEVVSEFLAKWREGYDIVFGQRSDRSADSPLRNVFSRGFYRLFNALTRTDLPEGAGDFRLLDRRAIDAMNRLGERARFNKGLYSWIGFRSIGVPYTVAERARGTSKWSYRGLVRFALDGLTSFSTVPLRVSSLLGLAISLTAITYSVVFLLYTLIFGRDLPGFPSLIVSIMFFSGVQLIVLGVLGEYVGRVYEEVKARPLYIVADEIGFSPSAVVSARTDDKVRRGPSSDHAP